MLLYTVQMAKWRKVKELDIPILDTTVKSGDPAFAPSWPIVLGVKSGEISEERYREEYLQLMRQSWVQHRDRWEEVLGMEKVAIACYCGAGKFCHRHILHEIFSKLAEIRTLPFEYGGEIA